MASHDSALYIKCRFETFRHNCLSAVVNSDVVQDYQHWHVAWENRSEFIFSWSSAQKRGRWNETCSKNWSTRLFVALLLRDHQIYVILTYLLTYLLHGAGYYLKSWLSLGISKNILLSCWIRRFITMFSKAYHWTLSWASRIQFAPSIPVSLRSILMASQPKPCKHLSPPPCMPHAPSTSSSLI
jgi:hypothetical protein